jgi:hypothetical protein
LLGPPCYKIQVLQEFCPSGYWGKV